MEKIFENFTVTVMKLNKLVQKIKTYEMREYGLKAIHVMCGYYLNLNADGLTAAELVKLTMEDKAAISRALTQLREKGLVSYDTKHYNAKIRLTEEGKKLAEYITAKSEKAVDAGSAFFTDEQREFFYKSLEGIADNLKKYYETLLAEQDK